MAKDNRRILTWSLNAGSEEYEQDLRNYWYKIYSIGLHEFGVTEEGKIYDFRTEQNYFNADGTHKGVRFPIIMENHIIDYPSIDFYFQTILFGWSKVKPVLDNNTTNAEGRLPQDQFILEFGKILDLYESSRNSGTPLDITGVEMDVEASMTNDYESQGNDVNYIAFLERVKNEVIIPRQLKMRVNAYAMWGDQVPYYYRFHNYKLFAESTDKNGNATIDEIQLMTYDFAWNGSAAGASTPIWWFRDVGDWCRQCFDPNVNPNAKLTIDNLFFGAAGYGHRWGMHDESVVKSGSVITFRNLLGWLNGLYKHYHTSEEDSDGDGTTETVYVYHDQPYLPFAGTQDEESKNQVMYPHIYDRFKPKYADISEQNDGSSTANSGVYSGNPYTASNFKVQQPNWTNVHAVTGIPSNVSGKAFASNPPDGVDDTSPYSERRQHDPNLDPDSMGFGHTVMTVDGSNKLFVPYYTENLLWNAVNEYDVEGNVIGASCQLENASEGLVEYKVNIPANGSYKVIAVTNFSWYSQSKFGGTVNGQSYSFGDNLPEWYPHFMKGTHWADIGTFDFAAGSNTITVGGSVSAAGTPVAGFVVCDAFDQNFTGGLLNFNANVQPFIQQDGTEATVPETLAVAASMLRRDARPSILWDEEFRTYGEGTRISGTTYYRTVQAGYQVAGNGSNAQDTGETDSNGQTVYECYSDPKNVGYSQGIWTQVADSLGQQCVHYDFNNSGNSADSGQIILTKTWSANLQIEATIQVESGRNAGIRFYAQNAGSVGDGYLFLLDFNEGVRKLILEEDVYNSTTGTWNSTQKTIASQPMGNVSIGESVELRVKAYEGTGRFYVGGTQAFIQDNSTPESTEQTKVTHDGSVNTDEGTVILQRTSGACGVYASHSSVYCYHLGIGTLDRWETMEKFELVVDGERRKFGEIARSGYSYDEFGYLIFSGIDETVTRDDTPSDGTQTNNGAGELSYESEVSLDFEISVSDWVSWVGGKNVQIKLVDAGVWFGELLVGDKKGMSVIWAGDAQSFLDVMNIGVNDYGAKGIGLWTMGQEDPRLFEMVPDVVPKK